MEQAERIVDHASWYAASTFVHMLDLNAREEAAFRRTFAEHRSSPSRADVERDVDEGKRIWELARMEGYGRDHDLAEAARVMRGCIDAPPVLCLHVFTKRWTDLDDLDS